MFRKIVITLGLLLTLLLAVVGCEPIGPTPEAPLEPAITDEVTPAPRPTARATSAPPTVIASPTNSPEPLSSLKDIQIARRYPLEVGGEILAENPLGIFWVPAWSPDGKTMLFKQFARRVPCYENAEKCGASVFNLWSTDSKGNSPTLLAKWVAMVDWSPSGTMIAYTQQTETGEASLWVMRLDGTEKKTVVEGINPDHLAWLEDNTLAYVSWDGSIMSIALDGTSVQQLNPQSIPRTSRRMRRAHEFALSPQSGCLALVDDYNRLWLIRLDADGEPVRIDPYDGAFSNIGGGLAWSPDGSRIAFASDSGIYFADCDGRGIAQVQTAFVPMHFAWSPDGKILAFIARTDYRGGSLEIYLTDSRTQNVKQLTYDEEAEGRSKNSLAWSPDGSRLVYGTSQIPEQKIGVIELIIN